MLKEQDDAQVLEAVEEAQRNWGIGEGKWAPMIGIRGFFSISPDNLDWDGRRINNSLKRLMKAGKVERRELEGYGRNKRYAYRIVPERQEHDAQPKQTD